MQKTLVFIIFIVCLISCGDKSELVVSKSQMEQILYDYHVTQAFVTTLPIEERYKAEIYMGAVYEKNNITKEQFDSSMVYYNRHADELKEIYDNLQDKLTAMNEKIQLQTGSNEMLTFSENGDTTSIWSGKKLLLLRNKDMLNKEVFKISADTSFYKGDKFILKADTRLINNEKRSRDYRVSMCLTAQYTDGKQISEYQHITISSSKQITLNTDKSKTISQVTGFFYYSGKSDERNFAIIDAVELIKIHTDKTSKPVVKEEAADSTTNNKTSPAEQDKVNERKTKTIEELNQERIKENKKVSIKSKPDNVRKNTGPIIRRQTTRSK